jgi:hypothetical protein
VPYSCKSASSTVTVFNRIYISPSFHISFILISQFFFDRSNCPYLIVRRPLTLTVRRLYVQSVTLILHLCIVSRLGSAARHHTFFLNASIYDVSSFSPSPLINSFRITCTCINDTFCLHVFMYKLFPYSVQYSIVTNGLIIQSYIVSGVVTMRMIHYEKVHKFDSTVS